ncbi:MAG: integrase core domain-containing protein [Gemmatimonadales bacterium]
MATLQPATVIRWHGLGWAKLWTFKSRQQRRPGRPSIPANHIALIQRISKDHPEWGEDKIAHELELKLGVKHSTSTIRKYMVRRLTPAAKSQQWLTFVTNHGSEMFAIDLATQHTALFKVVYIFIVMELGSRRIVHVNAATRPSLGWVKQQIREATPWGEKPRWLIHDNDGIFGQCGTTKPSCDKNYRCHLDRWLDETLGIEGIPTPYAAPQANARCERFVRTLRTEALNHFIFLNVDHVRRVVKRYVSYYNAGRPNQGTHAIPEPCADLSEPPRDEGEVVALPVLGGLHHDYRRAA